ncbi:MAG: hypothetical protein ACOCYV_00655 [Planctomycetota bacterium]
MTTTTEPATAPISNARAACLLRCGELLEMLIDHCGYGDLGVEVRNYKKGRKEVILRCGKHYRYIIPVNVIDHSGGNDCCCADDNDGTNTGMFRRNARSGTKPY